MNSGTLKRRSKGIKRDKSKIVLAKEEDQALVLVDIEDLLLEVLIENYPSRFGSEKDRKKMIDALHKKANVITNPEKIDKLLRKNKKGKIVR